MPGSLPLTMQNHNLLDVAKLEGLSKQSNMKQEEYCTVLKETGNQEGSGIGMAWPPEAFSHYKGRDSSQAVQVLDLP